MAEIGWGLGHVTCDNEGHETGAGQWFLVMMIVMTEFCQQTISRLRGEARMWPGSTSFLQLDIHRAGSLAQAAAQFMQLWIRPRHLDLGLAALSLSCVRNLASIVVLTGHCKGYRPLHHRSVSRGWTGSPGS